MSVRLNHTIVWCRDKQRSATFLAEILGRPSPTRFGPFLVVEVDNDASLENLAGRGLMPLCLNQFELRKRRATRAESGEA